MPDPAKHAAQQRPYRASETSSSFNDQPQASVLDHENRLLNRRRLGLALEQALPIRKSIPDTLFNLSRDPGELSFLRVALLAITVGLLALKPGMSQDAAEKPKEPPRVAMCVPLGIAVGETTTVLVRGWNLEGVKELRSSDQAVEFKLASTSKAAVPNGLDAKQVGDTQIELEASVAGDFKSRKVTVVLVGPDGQSQPRLLLVGSTSELVAEKESNDGFRQAQRIQIPQTVDGLIHDKRNVDVYSFEVTGQQRVEIEVHARRHGSALDSLLTLFNERGRIVAVNDDHDGSPDSHITTELPAGRYLISLQDAHDHGGAAHPYRLIIEPAPASEEATDTPSQSRP